MITFLESAAHIEFTLSSALYIGFIGQLLFTDEGVEMFQKHLVGCSVRIITSILNLSMKRHETKSS